MFEICWHDFSPLAERSKKYGMLKILVSCTEIFYGIDMQIGSVA